MLQQSPEIDAIVPAYSNEFVRLYHVDCFDWLRRRQPGSVHAVVTDPPYGFVEYQEVQLRKRTAGRGGVWRIPPTLDGYRRSPLPRFTVQSKQELALMSEFFREWARLVYQALVPGGHIFIATNPLLANRLYAAIQSAGFEQRGEFIRLVTTLRGGDRPKGAEVEFSEVTVMPKSYFEPWGIFRRPCEGKVSENLRKWATGGLRRSLDNKPFGDVFACSPAGQRERRIAPHPSLKPQALMRHLVRASLPLGVGTVLDPFAGSGATLAAAASLGYTSIGLESNGEYVSMAQAAVPLLASLSVAPVAGRGKPSSTAASPYPVG